MHYNLVLYQSLGAQPDVARFGGQVPILGMVPSVARGSSRGELPWLWQS